MKLGISETQAARTYHVSRKRLARYRVENTASKWLGQKWRIVDRRPATMLIISRGRLYSITVPFHSKSKVGRFWNAIQQFLHSNDPSYLKPFEGAGIRDVNRKMHPWETGPNTLRKLESIGELDVVDIYRNVAQ